MNSITHSLWRPRKSLGLKKLSTNKCSYKNGTEQSWVKISSRHSYYPTPSLCCCWGIFIQIFPQSKAPPPTSTLSINDFAQLNCSTFRQDLVHSSTRELESWRLGVQGHPQVQKKYWPVRAAWNPVSKDRTQRKTKLIKQTTTKKNKAIHINKNFKDFHLQDILWPQDNRGPLYFCQPMRLQKYLTGAGATRHVRTALIKRQKKIQVKLIIGQTQEYSKNQHQDHSKQW